MPQSTDKPAVLYELSALVRDGLGQQAGALAEAVERSADEVAAAVAKTNDRYQRGELTQSEHWGDIALTLALEDIETISAVALNGAEVDRELLGRIRAQSPVMTLGLISDATPDFVGHFRKTYQLDDLIHVHVIGSELAEEHAGLDYPGLLKLAAKRLQTKPANVNFVDRKQAHLKLAGEAGMRLIDLSRAPDLKSTFAHLA